MENWKEEFKKLIKNKNDSISLFPFGGDDHDFSEENCMKFIEKLLFEERIKTINLIFKEGKNEIDPKVNYLYKEMKKSFDLWILNFGIKNSCGTEPDYFSLANSLALRGLAFFQEKSYNKDS